MARLSLNETDEIADSFDPVKDIIRNFDAKLVFNHHYQFQTVEPVGVEVRDKMRLIGDMPEIDT